MTHFKRWSVSFDNRGFTLIEMIAVAGIIAFISTILLTQFSRSRIDLTQGTNFFTANVRSAQINAVASTKYNGYNSCGYGIHYIDANHFALYAGPNASSTTCSTINRNYQSNEDTLFSAQTFPDNRIHFTISFSDIFFEPPDPKTYLNNSAALNQAPIGISICQVGGSCPQNCKTVYVYPSGKIEVQ